MKKFVSLFSLIAAIYFISGCGLSEDTVAKVGDIKISVQDFKHELSKSFPNRDSYAEVDSATKRLTLNRMINQALKVNDAFELGLEDRADFKNEVENQKARLLGNKYFERVIVDKLISEQDLRDMFEKQKDEVKVSHILIAFKGAQRSRATRSKEEALKLAWELVKKARSGKSFPYLAEKYSDDPSAKQNKGNMGYFTWGRMVDAFQEKAFSMEVGKISDPVLTGFGYHIIKKEDHRPNAQFKEENFEIEKLNLKKRLYYAKRDTGTTMWNAHIEDLKSQYNFTPMGENIKQVSELTLSKTKNGQTKQTDYSDSEKETVLAEWSKGKITLGDLFMNFPGRRFEQLRKSMENEEKFAKTVEQLAIQKMVVADAESMGIGNEPDIMSQLNDFRYQRLANMAQKERVSNQAETNDEEVMAYYEENKDEFVKPAEIEIWEIYVTKESLAKKIAQWAKAGRDFEKLAEKYSEDNFYKKKKGYVGFKNKNRRGNVSREAFEAGENKIVGPVKYRKGWAVVKTGKMHPKTVKSFEEAKAQAKSKLRNKKLKELRENWESKIKESYSVRINEDLVQHI